MNDDEFSENFEEKITVKFKECIEEFTQNTLISLIRNSLHVLKNELLTESKIETLYYSLFTLMKIEELQHQSYFQSLRN